MKPLLPHPFSQLIPPMEAEQFANLRDDILTHGLLHPIILHEGKILDGNHRYKICQELSLDPQTIPFGGTNALEYAQSVNLHRRHLTIGQRAAIATLFCEELTRYRKSHPEEFPSCAHSLPLKEQNKNSSRGISARTHGVSFNSVQRAQMVRGISKKLFQEVFLGTKKLQHAVQEARAMRPGGPKGGRPWKIVKEEDATLKLPTIYEDWSVVWEMDEKLRTRGYDLVLARYDGGWEASYTRRDKTKEHPCYCTTPKQALVVAAREILK